MSVEQYGSNKPRPLGATGHLNGYRVLVVEDDYFVAQDLCSILRAHGATVIGPARSINIGRELANTQFLDCALLDINLHGEYAFTFAEEMQDRGVLTVFTTGYDTTFIPPRLHSIPCLQKPIEASALIHNIRRHAPVPARP